MLKFFINSHENGMNPSPNEMFRQDEQAFIDAQWDNTSAKIDIKEQDEIGSDTYNQIEAWATAPVGDVTQGLRNAGDFLKLLFKNINHKCIRGQHYIIQDNYWMCVSYTGYNGLPQDNIIRRCNNLLKIVDPLNGSIVSFPCIVDYDATAPNMQVGRYVNTPNSHLNVIVQGNELSRRILVKNTRYIINGDAYKLLAYQNALYNSEGEVTIMYLDLMLDEEHGTDDIENGIADNGKYDYKIVFSESSIRLQNGAVYKLNYAVTLNGAEIDRPVIWKTSNSRVATVSDGVITASPSFSSSCRISAYLDGNELVNNDISVQVTTKTEVFAPIIVEPNITKIRQYETKVVEFKLPIESPSVSSTIVVTNNSNNIIVEQIEGNKYAITGKNVSNHNGISLRTSDGRYFNSHYIDVTSMLG